MSYISPYASTIIKNLSDRLEERISFNSCLIISNEVNIVGKTCFDSKVDNPTPIDKILKCLMSRCSADIWTIRYTILLVQRYCEKTMLQITKRNCLKLILACFVISLKLNEDNIYTDKVISQILKVKLNKLNELESKILDDLDFKVAFLNFNNYE